MNKGVSIIICCYNSENRLSLVFNYLNQLIFLDKNLEIIVVDNASSDNTYRLAEQLIIESPWNGKVVIEPTPGLSFARKKGVYSASYGLILFCDDDNLLSEDYLQNGFQFFEKFPEVGCLGGYGFTKSLKNLPFWFEKLASSYAIGSLGKQDGIQKPGAIHYGAGLWFRAEPLKKYYSRRIVSSITDRKMESLASGGDSELCLAIQLEGYKVAYCSQLKFIHKVEVDKINEPYYLELRKGILGNYPILNAYIFLIDGKRKGFTRYVLNLSIGLIFGLIKSGINFFIQRDFIRKVHFLNYWWKLNGLIFNYKATFNLYNQLKLKYQL